MFSYVVHRLGIPLILTSIAATAGQQAADAQEAPELPPAAEMPTPTPQLVYQFLPPGSMAYQAGDLPLGWLPCDGSRVLRSEYSQLYAVVGDQYGAGDGSTTFQLPDCQGQPLMLWPGQTDLWIGQPADPTPAPSVVVYEIVSNGTEAQSWALAYQVDVGQIVVAMLLFAILVMQVIHAADRARRNA